MQTRTRVRLGVVLVVVIVVVVLVRGCGPGPKIIPVLGFQPEGASTSAISDNAGVISSVGVDGLHLTGPGMVSAVTAQERSQILAARGQELATQMLVTNYVPSREAFAEHRARETLKNPRLTARLAATLAGDAENGGWDGVVLDLELLKRRDSGGLVNLVTDLHRDLPSRDTVAVTLTNNISSEGFASEGYDLAGLAGAHAQLVLMAYDDHGPWESDPGPVGPLEWQEEGLQVMRRYVPARQIVLGVAGYGYAWEPHKTVALGVDQARTLASTSGAQTRWAPGIGEWTSKLPDGTTIWWADSRSFQVRVKLARELHLHGLAVWSLASVDPLSF